MLVNVRRRSLFLPLLFPFCVSGQPLPLYIEIGALTPYQERFVLQSIDSFNKQYPPDLITTNYSSQNEIKRKESEGIEALFLTTSAFYTQQQRESNLRGLLSLSRQGADPSLISGTLAIGRRRDHLTVQDEVKSKKIGFNPDWAFWGKEGAVGSIFGSQEVGFKIPVHGGPDALIHALRQGQIDIALLPACTLEESENSVSFPDIEAISPVSRFMIPCLHTSWLYPGPILASSKTVPPSRMEKLSQFLISLPNSTRGYQWRLPSLNNQRLETLLTQLGLDSYSSLEKNTWFKFWEKYKNYIYISFLMLLGLLAHMSFLSFLVKKKTKQLTALMQEREIQYEKDRENIERIEALQRVSIVGLMGSMFAHEIRQPLSSIRCWLYSIKETNKKKSYSNEVENFVQQVNSDVDRIEHTISNIRSYIRSKQKDITLVCFYDLVVSALDSLPTSERKTLNIIWQQCDRSIMINVEIFEMRLALINAFRNSLDAQATKASKTIFLSLYENDSDAVLEISDLGDPLKREDIEKVTDFFFSKKKEGMGLGLPVIRSILANYQGRLEIALTKESRFQVKFVLPMKK